MEPIISTYFSAIRPKTLIASISPVALGGVLAIDSNQFSIFVWVLISLAALLIQIGTNLANDYFDYLKGADREDRLGPVRLIQSGELSPKVVLYLALASLLAALMAGIFLVWLGGFPILVIGILSLILAITYTSGPFPLAYLGLADLFVLVFFGPVAVWGTYYLLTGESSLAAIILGPGTGRDFYSNTCCKQYSRRRAGQISKQKTLIVRFGTAFGKREYFVMLVLAFLLPLYFYYYAGVSNLIFLTYLVPIFNLKTFKTVLFKEGQGIKLCSRWDRSSFTSIYDIN